MGSQPKGKVESVNALLRTRQHVLSDLRQQLIKAQERMKRFADPKRSERSFSKGDWVYLKLHPYRQLSISGGQHNKLSPKFYGPYEILEKVGSVAYKLNLPATSTIHPIIHVSQLKARVGSGTMVSPTLPIVGILPPAVDEPECILNRRLIKRQNLLIPQILVKWRNKPSDDATWEDYDSIKRWFPLVNLEDKIVAKGEGLSRATGSNGLTVDDPVRVDVELNERNMDETENTHGVSEGS